MKRGVTPVKRSVAIHPAMDKVVKEIYSILLRLDYRGITYSTALNLLLLAGFMETQQKEKGDWGWSRETHEVIREFLQDRASVYKVVNEDTMPAFRIELPYD